MSGYISLDELPHTFEEGRGTLAWQFQASASFDTHGMEVHVPRTEGAIRAFGFGGLIVKSVTGEQISHDVSGMDVAGINPDGSAVGAARGRVTRVDSVSSSLEDDFFLDGSSRWPTATVEINRTELASRIVDRKRNGTDERVAQTKELDRALRIGLVKAALQKNKKDLFDFRGSLEPGVSGVFTSSEVVGIVAHDPLFFGATAGIMHGFLLVASAIAHKMQGAEHVLAGKRLSIFPGSFQPDRFVLGAALTAARVIRYNEKKSQPPVEW